MITFILATGEKAQTYTNHHKSLAYNKVTAVVFFKKILTFFILLLKKYVVLTISAYF